MGSGCLAQIQHSCGLFTATSLPSCKTNASKIRQKAPPSPNTSSLLIFTNSWGSHSCPGRWPSAAPVRFAGKGAPRMPGPQCCRSLPTPTAGAGGFPRPRPSSQRTSRPAPLPALAGGPGLPSTCTCPEAPRGTRSPGPWDSWRRGTAPDSPLFARNSLRPNLGESRISRRWPRQPGKARLPPGPWGPGRRGGASRVTGRANYPEPRVLHSGLPRACQKWSVSVQNQKRNYPNNCA